MLSGKQKAQLLLSQLGDRASDVLSHLTPESASLLTASLEDSPQIDPPTLQALGQEVLHKVNPPFPVLEQEETIFDIEEEEDNVAAVFNETNLMEESTEHPEPASTEIKLDPVNQKADDVEDLAEDNLLYTPTDDKPRYSTLQILEFAEELKNQKPQMIAFLLSKHSEEDKEAIVSHLPDDLQISLSEINVEAMPISDQVYDKLYMSFLKQIELKKQQAADDNLGVFSEVPLQNDEGDAESEENSQSQAEEDNEDRATGNDARVDESEDLFKEESADESESLFKDEEVLKETIVFD